MFFLQCIILRFEICTEFYRYHSISRYASSVYAKITGASCVFGSRLRLKHLSCGRISGSPVAAWLSCRLKSGESWNKSSTKNSEELTFWRKNWRSFDIFIWRYVRCVMSDICDRYMWYFYMTWIIELDMDGTIGNLLKECQCVLPCFPLWRMEWRQVKSSQIQWFVLPWKQFRAARCGTPLQSSMPPSVKYLFGCALLQHWSNAVFGSIFVEHLSDVIRSIHFVLRRKASFVSSEPLAKRLKAERE